VRVGAESHAPTAVTVHAPSARPSRMDATVCPSMSHSDHEKTGENTALANGTDEDGAALAVDPVTGTDAEAVVAEPPAPPQTAQAAPTPEAQTPSPWLLIVCCVAQFMVILDLSIVNVALPSIQASLNFTSADLQWVVDAYAIAFAGFLMLGGRAADQLGQRRVFVMALVLFSVTSLVGGAAVNRQMLVVARGVQGFSCAFMAASSLAIITSSFKPGPQMHRAIGLWAAMNGLGGAAGTLFGGIITEELSWRWVLLINPPIGIATAMVAWAVVADRRRGEGGRSFDIPGAVTLTLGSFRRACGAGTTHWRWVQSSSAWRCWPRSCSSRTWPKIR
jgi:hypothetical protein